MVGLLCGTVALASGCTTLAWYGQAARGQAELLLARKDIEKALDSPALSGPTRDRLREVPSIRRFARTELALPADGSYTDFVALDREAVVWNVVAAPEFSVQPHTWCYPIAGCVAYRGHFRRAAARKAARRLAAQGLDVVVAPVSAYSTLGWFDDPVTGPMLRFPLPSLAGLIFHELAHQRVWTSGDAAFNESYATAVEREGVRRWLTERDEPDRLRRWQRSQRLEAGFIELLLDARGELERLYAQPLRPAVLRARKAAVFLQLRGRYRSWARMHGTDGFDAWFERSTNNAGLALVATYAAGADAFGDLLAEYDGDFERFHRAVERLAAAGQAARAEFLARSRNPSSP